MFLSQTFKYNGSAANPMALITPFEVLDVIIMSFAIGYIFSGRFQMPVEDDYDPLVAYQKRFHWNEIFYSAAIVAPGIILHEISHKVVAMLFGLSATFHASYTFLILGIILRAVNFGFIFFVPAYVSIFGSSTDLQSALIAIAGPLTNLLIWAVLTLAIKFNMVKKKLMAIFIFGQKVNLFLFIFNIIPIPGFDGFQFFVNIIRVFTG